MKRLYFTSIIAIVALALAACTGVRGSGTLVEDLREVRGFNALQLAGTGDVTIRLGEREALTVRTDDNLIDDVTSEVRGNTLVLTTRPNTLLYPTQGIQYTLTVISLESIDVSGSGSVSVPAWTAEAFNIAVSGSGSVSIAALETDSLTIDLSGSGEVRIAGGAVTRQSIDLSGGGDYDALALTTETTTISLSGSGTAQLNVMDTLLARVSGSGEVRYTGAATLDSAISGSGSVRRIE